jgi:hypothetical protein
MDAFEEVVAGLFFRDGFWVSQGFKVELTPEEKKAIGRPSSPRWEIDLLAFKGTTSELLALECKSYLDSPGVAASDIINPSGEVSRYKLFVDSNLRQVVLNRLALQLHQTGLVPPGTVPKLALATGKIRSLKDTALLHSHFKENNWHLFDTDWLVAKLRATAGESYFDSVAHVVSKLLLRNGQYA